MMAVRQGGTVAERYQGGVAYRSAEAAAAWWHLLSDAAVSAARAAASSGAKRSRSVRAVHAALASSGGTVAPWPFPFKLDDFEIGSSPTISGHLAVVPEGSSAYERAVCPEQQATSQAGGRR